MTRRVNSIAVRGVFMGRYRVVRRLGAGAWGAVYEVVDLETGRRRALKVTHEPAADRSGDEKRCRREARIVGQIDSPFIVDVLDVGVDHATGRGFLVMELLHGEDLGRRLRRLGPLPAAEVVLTLHQAAAALDLIHRAGIVHRDLKPSNLFRDTRDASTPRLKILDFGAAVRSDEVAETAGTPMYMAPEQFRTGAIACASTDVFALGMVAFALLAGRAYWADEWERCGDPLRFALTAVRGPTRPAGAQAARHGVALIPTFDDWFVRATEPDPGRRFSSAGAAAGALANALGVTQPPIAPAADPAAPGVPWSLWSLAEASRPAADETPQSGATETIDRGPARPPSRQRWPLTALVAAAFGMCTIGRAEGAPLDDGGGGSQLCGSWSCGGR